MYTQQFGLEKPVFDGGIAQHEDLFLGPRQQRVAANLKIGLTTRDSVVALTGPLGVGKTTLAAHALSITATRLAQSWVGNMPLAPDEMLESLLASLELDPYAMGRVQRIHTWRQFVGEMSATDTRICILVEDALELGAEGLQALEALTAADPNDCPGANLILMSPTGLQQLLEEPGLARLKQRIRSRQRLDPMTPQEVEKYLRHRMTVAGGDYEKIFAPGTAAMVHCFSAGIPRVINNVCETALIVAATRKATQLTPEIVQRVAEGVYGLAPSVQLPEAPAATAPAPTATPVAAAKEPPQKPVPPAEPVPVEAAPSAPAAAPVAAVKPAAEKAVPPTEPAPIDAAARVDPGEAKTLEVPAIIDLSDSVEPRPEPPTLTEADVVDADVEPQPAAAVSETTGAASNPSTMATLIEEIDFDLPGDSEDVVEKVQPPAATLPPDAPSLPEEELEADEDFSEDFAAATHLHEISDEMAEMLFSADPAASATGIFKAATPLESDEDDVPASDKDQADPEAVAATTLVF